MLDVDRYSCMLQLYQVHNMRGKNEDTHLTKEQNIYIIPGMAHDTREIATPWDDWLSKTTEKKKKTLEVKIVKRAGQAQAAEEGRTPRSCTKHFVRIPQGP